MTEYGKEIEELSKTVEPWKPQTDGRALGEVLLNPVVKKALATLLRDQDDVLQQLRNVSLTTAEGVSEAIRLQGALEGRTAVVEAFIQLAGDSDGE